MPILSIAFAAALAASPGNFMPSTQMEALAIWTDAYRSCYEPAPFSLAVDRPATMHCIALRLAQAREGAPAALGTALSGLERETPRLIDALNSTGAPAKPRLHRSARR